MTYQQATLPFSMAGLLAAPIRPGHVVWIGCRPGRRQPLEAMTEAAIDPLTGLAGDHYSNQGTRSRQVTLIAQEALSAIAAFLGRAAVPPELLRRNVVIAGINPYALKAHTIRLGSVVLEVTGECHPCSRMEEVLGPGGYNAVRGHGGLTARVVTAGSVRLGDPVERLQPTR